ncbi:MAG TPA: transposase [Actinomycetes bacterium]|nr:transposase [Actinomycetes bacterium]
MQTPGGVAQDVFESLPRKDQRARGECCLRGLMLDGRRNSMEPMAPRYDDAAFLKFVAALGRRPRARLRWMIPAATMAAATGKPESAAWSGRRRPAVRRSGRPGRSPGAAGR